MSDDVFFRLISQTTPFRFVRRFEALGGTLPCVVGVTLDGRGQTVARVEDVVFFEEPEDATAR